MEGQRSKGGVDGMRWGPLLQGDTGEYLGSPEGATASPAILQGLFRTLGWQGWCYFSITPKGAWELRHTLPTEGEGK